MTLIIQKPTGAKLVMAQTYVGIDDPDAAVYVAAVEAADGQSLETATKVAIHSFVKGCKNDGIWPAIKASCILAGARTLTGALVPLVGAAPTNFNFVSGDYNRKTGLVGNGSTKYLDSKRNNNADPQNNAHRAVYITTAQSNAAVLTGSSTTADIGGSNLGGNASTGNLTSSFRDSLSAATALSGQILTTGLKAQNRSAAASYTLRSSSTNNTISTTSATALAGGVFIFDRGPTPPHAPSNARIAFYSIGESLNLALLDARVTDLINAFAAAIP
jgi:hypothetical protein